MEPGVLLTLLAAHKPLKGLAETVAKADAARLLVAPVPVAARPAVGALLARAIPGPTVCVT